MGICSSGPELTAEQKAERKFEKERNKHVESAMDDERDKDQNVLKLLLLGAGESGKSTLFKQMTKIYGPGFTEEDRAAHTNIIYNNVLMSIKTLCKQCVILGHEVQSENELSRRTFDEDVKGDEEINEIVGEHIRKLWEDPGIQATYEERAKYQLTDSAKWFFEKIEEIGHPDYIPSEQDVLRARVRTTGIVENQFEIEGNKFKMFDVGGQRNERKKWIHCFENVTAVIFVAAISEYDQTLYEDETTNRVVEALTLFREICSSIWFEQTSIILFLNKRDLFIEKVDVQNVPVKDYFEQYNGPNDAESASIFFREEFESLNHQPDKQIYTQFTCATDTNQIETVFNAVKDIIIRKSLGEAGLV